MQSSEIGFAYLVPSNAVANTIDTVAKLDALVTSNSASYTKTTISAFGTNTNIVAPSTIGAYKLIVADAVGNVSSLTDSDIVTVDNF